MSFSSIHLLAESDFPKGIIPVIVFVIWIASTIVTALKKKTDGQPTQSRTTPTSSALEAFQREIAARLGQPLPPAPPPLRTQTMSPPPLIGGNPQINIRQNQLKQLQEQRQRAIKQAKQSKKRAVPSPMVQRPEPVAQPIIPAISRPEPIAGRATHAALPAVNAVVLAKWMKPATLRQQFIITEIFQPPLSMRH